MLPPRWSRPIIMKLALIVIVLSVLSVVGNLLGLAWMYDWPPMVKAGATGGMAPFTAFCFIMVGICIYTMARDET